MAMEIERRFLVSGDGWRTAPGRVLKQGFIAVSRERVVRVRLTPAGRALRSRARVIPGCILEATGLSLEELRRLQGEIDALRRNLEAANR